MYSDKVSAVIRELTCNARDAHTAAGKEGEPYTVHLPTVLEPHFHVRDTGIGLCFDDIMSLYTTYGESLKNESNDMIGGLGLGSKAGFAYADQYTVEGRWEGEKFLFSCYVDEKGEPQIAHLNTTSTTDCNGLTVTIPVNKDDIGEFISKATFLFEYYEPRPICNTSLEYLNRKVTISGSVDRWEVYDDVRSSYNYKQSKATAIQGQVCYPIDRDKLTNVSGELLTLLRGINLNIWFNIGELEVAANRENLSYSDYTIRNIESRLKVVYDDMLLTAQQQIEDCTSLWDASIKADQLSDIFNNNHTIKDTILSGMTYGNKPIHKDKIKMEKSVLSTVWSGKIRYVPYSSCHNIKLTFRDLDNYDRWRVQQLHRFRFYFFNTDNTKYKLPSTIKAHLDGDKYYVILLEGSRSELKKVLGYLGNPPYIDTSTLAVPEAVKRGSGVALPAKLREYTSQYYNEWGTEVDKDMSSGGVYVRLLRGWPSDVNSYSIKEKVTFLRENLHDLTPIYGIPGTYHKRLDKNSDVWVSLDDYYEKACKKARLSLGNKAEINKFLELSTVYRSMENNIKNFLTLFKDDSTIKFKYDILNSAIKDYREYLILDIKYMKKSTSIEKLFSPEFNTDYETKHIEEMNKVWTKHPVLMYGLNTYKDNDDVMAMKPDIETLLEDWSN